MKLYSALAILGLFSLNEQVKASYFENIEEIENFKWDKVIFRTKKDCALDGYPDMK